MHSRSARIALLSIVSGALGAGRPGPGDADTPGSVPLYGRFETEVKNEKEYSNPFQDVLLDATFTSPSKRAVKFFGFHDGDGKGGQTGSSWKLRFMPDEVGTWSYVASFSDGAPGASGTFACVAEGAMPGPLRVDPENRRSWVFAGGGRFFPRSYMAPELFVAANKVHRKHWIDFFFGGKHRFNLSSANLLNFVAVGDVYNWQGKPYRTPDPGGDGLHVTIPGNGLFPFLREGPRLLFDGGSNVDWLRPSIACWRNVDEVLGELEARKVIWFNHWGMVGWEWGGNGKLLVPPSARKAVLRYWIARLAPYWNITWNLAGEWDELMTPEEIDELGSFVKENDPWKHPVTSHALGTTADRPWVDFRVEQLAAGTSGDAVANSSRAIADDSGKPVFAFETSWEAVPGKLTADAVRTGAWGSTMGGAFHLYAECFEPTLTWGDGGAFPYVEIMNDFFATIPYWKLSPRNDLVDPGSLCLADPGREYVIYRQRGGSIALDLFHAPGTFALEWIDPRTGARQGATALAGGARHMLTTPDATDWAIHLRKAAIPAAGPLRVHPKNPRYFTDGTTTPGGSLRAVYLTGSHTWGNLCDSRERWPAFDYAGYLDFLERHGHNFIRLWSGDGIGHQPVPYERTGPGTANDGGLKVDLERFDPAFFDRLRSRVIASRERGMYVAIMLFSPDGAKREDWKDLLYNPRNNVQGIDADTNGDGSGAEAYDLSISGITAYQEAFVRKVIDTVNDLDNVLYEIGNEGDLTSVRWQYHFIEFIRKREADRPKRHPVGMTAVFDIVKGSWATDDEVLFASEADWVSPGLAPYKDSPPAADGKKVIIADVDHIWPAAPHRGWIWECFLRGIQPILMDWYTYGDPEWTSRAEQDAMRLSMGYALAHASRMDLAAALPRGDLASSGYCLAQPGKEYLVYRPGGGEGLRVELPAGKYRYEWFDPGRGIRSGSGEVESPGGAKELHAPFEGEAILHLEAESMRAR